MPQSRRSFVVSVGALPALMASPSLALAQSEAVSPLFAASLVLMGVERVAKLQLERRLLPERSAIESPKAKQRVQAALAQLQDQPKLLAGLSSRRKAQFQAVADEAARFVDAPPELASRVFSDSEALMARLGFITTTLSGLVADPMRGAQVDLLARAGASALRVGKINFAAAQAPKELGLQVSARQALIEFSSALEAVGQQDLSKAQQQDLQLAQNQWLLFRAVLNEGGLVKDASRLTEVATTTDRIAESLSLMAQKALRS